GGDQLRLGPVQRIDLVAEGAAGLAGRQHLPRQATPVLGARPPLGAVERRDEQVGAPAAGQRAQLWDDRGVVQLAVLELDARLARKVEAERLQRRAPRRAVGDDRESLRIPSQLGAEVVHGLAYAVAGRPAIDVLIALEARERGARRVRPERGVETERRERGEREPSGEGDPAQAR